MATYTIGITICAKLLVFICVAAFASHCVSSGTFFQKVSDNEDGFGAHASITSILTKEFHQCSIKNGCHFVALSEKDNSFHRAETKEDLEKVGTDLTIWEKVENHKDMEKETPKSEKVFKSCKEAMASGIHQSGPIAVSANGSTVRVFCDMVTDGGGWAIFQKRISSTVSFQRNWTEYENGFGDLQGSFWLGLKALHRLTSEGVNTLRIDLWDKNGIKGFAKYTNFSIGSAQEKYKISFGNFSGDILDSMLRSRGMAFSTVDSDNDLSSVNCADKYKGGWWFSNCYAANLNNLYPGTASTTLSAEPNADFMSWHTWTYNYGTIRITEMKFKNENKV